jgi:hypothetical protein
LAATALPPYAWSSHVDWCFVQRRDTVSSGVNAAFREFVIANGADWARCRLELVSGATASAGAELPFLDT